MKLNDVRKLAIRGQLRVRFDLSNGMECEITEHGLSKVANLGAIPNFDLEDEFERASRFRTETVAPPYAKDKFRPERRELTREELSKLVGSRTTVVEKEEE